MLEGEKGVSGGEAVRALLLGRAVLGQEAVHEKQALTRMLLRLLWVQPDRVQRYCEPPVWVWPALESMPNQSSCLALVSLAYASKCCHRHVDARVQQVPGPARKTIAEVYCELTSTPGFMRLQKHLVGLGCLL